MYLGVNLHVRNITTDVREARIDEQRNIEENMTDETLVDSNKKVKVEEADGANDEELLASKEKEMKQEILDHAKNAFDNHSISISSRAVQNKKRKRGKGGSWTRQKKMSSRNILQSKTELEKNPPGLEFNPYHIISP